ncbi:hypothetical protein NUU61_001667 [Penicillium alfredii]|uniref:GPI anchored protein n=1 Tax=Penicillium alfredii TaxID=1506179 RepID=A0A9W9FQ56_9EURO|nr:uncharacterized protein NUU61_001667 [Penicillium alfredii]KAJ5104320.1 hypothetical protein NUU61_001667 [Penicillium alfredii]
MRVQQFFAVAGLLLAGNGVIAAKLERDDVPRRCWEACGSVVGTASSCDARHDNDSAELKCICNWGPAKTQIPLCAACITQSNRDNDRDHDHDRDDDHDDDRDNDRDNDRDYDDDNEALDIVHSCSFSTTTYNAAAASSTGPSSSGTSPASDTASSTNSANSSGGQGSGTASGSASPATATDAGACLSVPWVASVAAVVGLMSFAWL